MKKDLAHLTDAARELRRIIFEMTCLAGGTHIGPAFSIVEILTVLYFGGIMKYDPDNPNNSERDRFILSKGHACAALYAVLGKAGFFPLRELAGFCRSGSIFGGHPKLQEIPGVEASTGSLGHGLGFGVGIAKAGKLLARPYNVYVVVGDGECQEGSIWEGVMFAAQHRLSNLTVVVDYNKFQAMDRLEKICGLDPLAAKWEAFGWNVQEVDGHDLKMLSQAFANTSSNTERPNVIIANTIKGKGVSYMEENFLWHYRAPSTEEIEIARKELGFEGGVINA